MSYDKEKFTSEERIAKCDDSDQRGIYQNPISLVELENRSDLERFLEEVEEEQDSIKKSETIFNLLVEKFSFSNEVLEKIITESKKIFHKLRELKISQQIPEKLNAEVIAGGVLYYLNFIHGVNSISYNQFYENLKNSSVYKKETYRKYCSEVFNKLMEIYKIKYRTLIREKIKYIIYNLESLASKTKKILYERTLNILEDILNPCSNNFIILKSNINIKIIASAIIYLATRITEDINFIDAAQIGRIVGVDRKLIVNYFFKNLKERFLEELEGQGDRVALTKEKYLDSLIDKYNMPLNSINFAKTLINTLRDDSFTIMDKTIALTIVYITSQVCDDFSIPLERLCKDELSNESSIYHALISLIPYLEEIENNIESYELDLNLFELRLLIKLNPIEKIEYCIDFIIEKLNLPEYSKKFSREILYKLINRDLQPQIKAVKSIAGECVYLSIAFFELNHEENIYPFLSKIGYIINVHKDNIEKKSGLFKEIYFEAALDYLKQYSDKIIFKLEKSKIFLNLIYAYISKIYEHFKEKDKIGQRFSQFSVSIGSVAIFIMSILKDDNIDFENIDEFIDGVLSLTNIEVIRTNFESSLFLLLKIINSEFFLEVISFIFKKEIFPMVRTELNIPSDKAPLLLDIYRFYPAYCIILWKRPYKYGHDSVYYYDIIAELGYKEIEKDRSFYFPYVGGATPEPDIAHLENLTNYNKLRLYLEDIYENKGLPENIIKQIVDNRDIGIVIPRISKFKIRGVRYKQRLRFENRIVKSSKKFKEGHYRLEDGYIKKGGAENIYSDYAHPKHYNEKEILGHGQPEHSSCLKNILTNDDDSVGIEIPIWVEYSGSYLTGHIDLLSVIDNAVKVSDYKPTSFFHALPQVATYGLILMKKYDIPDLNCVIFNKEKVWEFKPEPILKMILSFLKNLDIDLFWFRYVNYLLNFLKYHDISIGT